MKGINSSEDALYTQQILEAMGNNLKLIKPRNIGKSVSMTEEDLSTVREFQRWNKQPFQFKLSPLARAIKIANRSRYK